MSILDRKTRVLEKEPTTTESARLYRFLLDNVWSGVIIVDRSGKILFTNKYARETFGYTENEIAGKRISSFLARSSVPPAMKALAMEFLGKQQGAMRLEARAKNGETRYIEIAPGSVPTDYNGTNGVLVSFRDVTNVEREKEAHLEDEQRFRDIFDNANDLILYVDMKGKILEVNSKLKDTLGFEKKDVIGRNFAAIGIIPVKELPKMVSMFGNFVMKKNARDFVELELRHKSGRMVPTEISVNGLETGGEKGVLTVIRDMSERRKAEQAVAESGERFRKMFENVSDYMIYINKYGKLLDVNKRALDVVGKKKEDMVGKRFDKLGIFPLKDMPKMIKAFAELLKGGSTAMEMSVIDRNGKVVPVDCSATIMKTGNDIDGILLVARDLSEKRKADMAIGEQEKRFRDIFENVSDAIIYVDRTGRVVDVNPRVAEFGYAREDIIGKNALKAGFFPPKEAARMAILFAQSVATGKVAKLVEAKVRKKDGTIATVEISTRLVRREGKVENALYVFRDVSGRAESEKEMRMMASIVRYSNDAIISEDLEGNVTSWNAAAERIYGYSASDIMGKNISIAVPPERKAQLEEIFAKVRRGEDIRQLESERVRKDGRKISVSLSFSPLMDASGKVTGISVISRDVTSQKESEENFRVIFEKSADAIFIADVETRKLVDCNLKAMGLMGMPREKLLSMRADELHPEDVKEEAMEAFRRQATGEINYFETEILTNGGKRVPVSINAAFIERGGKKMLEGIFMDVSERKRAEREIEKRNEELEKSKAELQRKIIELEKFSRLSVGRELRMVEMKKRIKELEKGKG